MRLAFEQRDRLVSVQFDALAEGWGMSERSLRRRLAEENTTLSGLIEAELFARAKVHLLDRTRRLPQIAEELGYDEVNSFLRAFKRWAGLTPSEFRRRESSTQHDG